MNRQIINEYRQYLLDKIQEFEDIVEGLEIKGNSGSASAYGIWLKAYKDAIVKLDAIIEGRA